MGEARIRIQCLPSLLTADRTCHAECELLLFVNLVDDEASLVDSSSKYPTQVRPTDFAKAMSIRKVAIDIIEHMCYNNSTSSPSCRTLPNTKTKPCNSHRPKLFLQMLKMVEMLKTPLWMRKMRLMRLMRLSKNRCRKFLNNQKIKCTLKIRRIRQKQSNFFKHPTPRMRPSSVF